MTLSAMLLLLVGTLGHMMSGKAIEVVPKLK